MAEAAKFCPNCGQPVGPGLRFCEQCGHPLVETGPAGSPTPGVPPGLPQGGPSASPPQPAYTYAPAPAAPPVSPQRASPLPWIVAGLAVGLLCLFLAGAGVFVFLNASRSGQQSAVIALPTASTSLPVESRPAATETSTPRVMVSTVTPPPPSPTTSLPTQTATSTPTPTSTRAPTDTPTPTPTTTTAPTVVAAGGPGYDLYVKRIDYAPAGADLTAGRAVRFNVLIATDTYPPSGPYFPTTRLRWRPGDGTAWAEALCPANTQAASCASAFEHTYTRAGVYTFEVEIDSRGEIVESNKNNNTGRVDLQVNAAPIPTTAPTTAPPTAPVYSAVTFSADFDQNTQKPVNPGSTFAYGVKIVYAYWTYSGVTPGGEFSYTFYKDGSVFAQSAERFLRSSGSAWQWVLIGASPTVALEPATYGFSVFVNNKIVTSGNFVIQPPAVGGPIPGAFSVFFTIQSGNPTGWVYDKQGGKHSPVSRTISNLRVAPNDRIVLSTDQTRFSLLFDCSTTPGTFNPCDFVSDSTANLPKEIRAVKSGMSGYLNISRADNWAGARPGFPGQRYPADPILRIVFSW